MDNEVLMKFNDFYSKSKGRRMAYMNTDKNAELQSSQDKPNLAAPGPTRAALSRQLIGFIREGKLSNFTARIAGLDMTRDEFRSLQENILDSCFEHKRRDFLAWCIAKFDLSFADVCSGSWGPLSHMQALRATVFLDVMHDKPLQAAELVPSDTTQDQIDAHCLFQMACIGGHLESAKWVAGRFGITPSQAILDDTPTRVADSDKPLLTHVCISGRREVAEWLIEKFGLLPPPGATKFATELLVSCMGCEDPGTPKWVVSRFGLTREDANSVADQCLLSACKVGTISNAEWLLETFRPDFSQKQQTETFARLLGLCANDVVPERDIVSHYQPTWAHRFEWYLGHVPHQVDNWATLWEATEAMETSKYSGRYVVHPLIHVLTRPQEEFANIRRFFTVSFGRERMIAVVLSLLKVWKEAGIKVGVHPADVAGLFV